MSTGTVTDNTGSNPSGGAKAPAADMRTLPGFAPAVPVSGTGANLSGPASSRSYAVPPPAAAPSIAAAQVEVKSILKSSLKTTGTATTASSTKFVTQKRMQDTVHRWTTAPVDVQRQKIQAIVIGKQQQSQQQQQQSTNTASAPTASETASVATTAATVSTTAKVPAQDVAPKGIVPKGAADVHDTNATVAMAALALPVSTSVSSDVAPTSSSSGMFLSVSALPSSNMSRPDGRKIAAKSIIAKKSSSPKAPPKDKPASANKQTTNQGKRRARTTSLIDSTAAPKRKKSKPNPPTVAAKAPADAAASNTKAVTASIQSMPKAPVTTKSTKKASSKQDSAGNNNIVFQGVPTESIPGMDWTGWVKETRQRLSGKSKGHFDSYWISPVEHHRFRSLAEIKRFLEHMKQCQQDESAALAKFKSKRS